MSIHIRGVRNNLTDLNTARHSATTSTFRYLPILVSIFIGTILTLIAYLISSVWYEKLITVEAVVVFSAFVVLCIALVNFNWDTYKKVHISFIPLALVASVMCIANGYFYSASMFYLIVTVIFSVIGNMVSIYPIARIQLN